MRDLLITLFILGSIPLSLKRPFLGLLVFSMLAYMRLQDLAWGFARFQRWSMLVALVSFAGYAADRYRGYPLMTVRTWLLFGMVAQVGIGLFFAVGDEPVDYAGYVEYVKIIFIAVFTTAVVRTPSQLRILIWVVAMSLGFHGAKNGLVAVIKLGNLYIDHGPGGLIKDNNDFALAIAMTIPWIYYLGRSEKNPILTPLLKLMVPLCALTVISTRSRGGTLSLALMGAVIIWRSRNRFMGLIVGIAAVLVVVVMAPKEYKERVSGIQDYEEDGSAMGRLRAWAVALRMIDAHPVFGVGFGRFAINHLEFQPNPTLGEQAGGKALVAHNSYFQIWAESGTPAFIMYMGLIFLTFWDIWTTRWRAQKLYYDSWILSYCSMFEASLATFVLGSVFLNRAAFDLTYHLFAVVIVFGHLARKQMAIDEGKASSIRNGRGSGPDVGVGDRAEVSVEGPSRPRFRRIALES